MRRLAVLAAVLAAVLIAAPAGAQAPGSVVVNEISYDPPAPQPSSNEWVEVVNRSAAAVDLGGLRVVDSAGGTSAAVPGSLVVPPGGFAVLVANGTAFAAAYPGVAFTALATFPSLNNTGDTVRLVLGGTDLDAVPYLPSWGGTDASLERRDPAGPSDQASNFGTTTDPAFGTPGRQNSLFVVDTTPPGLDGAEALDATTVDVTFTEPVTAASAQQAGNYSVSGQGAPASAVLTAPAVVRLTLATPLTGPAGYTLTVTGVSDAAGNAITTAQTAFFFGTFATPAPRDIVVNEVMFDPPPGQPSTNEWVEVFNRSDQTFDLSALRFADSASALLPITGTPTTLPPGGYAVIGRDAAAFSAAYPGVPFVAVPGFPTLNNDADRPAIALADGTVIDAVPYRASWGGSDASLERRDPAGPSSAAVNFGTTTDPTFGTPGRQNALFAIDMMPPGIDGAEALDATTIEVTFTEPVDAATAQQAGNYSLSGAGSPVSATLTSESVVRLALAAPLTGPASYTLTVTNIADASGNVLAQAQTTFFFGTSATPAPRDVVVNEIMFDPPPEQASTNEWVEIYNRSDQTFDLSALRFADSASALLPITGTPTTLPPGGYAVIGRDAAAFSAAYPGVPFIVVAGFPTLNNDADRPAITLADGTVIDAVPYRVSWGGTDASLERKDPNGPSTSARNFATSTAAARATPGARNSVFAPDVTGPMLVSATASPDGRTVTVVVDEPVDPATVTPAAFAVTGTSVSAAVYDDAALTVMLTLASPLTGATTVTATGLRDGLGNTTATASTPLAFTPDTMPPGLVTATAETATTVRVVFTEPVTVASAQAATYALDGGIGAPTTVAPDVADGFATGALLTLPSRSPSGRSTR